MQDPNANSGDDGAWQFTHYRKSKQWAFNDADRQGWSRSHWQCPTALVEDLAEYWHIGSGTRGSGSVASVLPVLCLAVRPRPGEDWSSWGYLSHHRIALLSGVCRDTVAAVFGALEKEGLLEHRHDRVGRYQNRIRFRLLAEAFCPAREPSIDACGSFVKFYGNFIYGGLWSLLPTSAARHLFLAFLCADPVHDPRSFAHAITEGCQTERAMTEARRVIMARRQPHALSFSDLVVLTGMTRPVVNNAVKILTTSFVVQGKKARYVRREYQHPQGPNWYVPSRRVMRLRSLDPAVLNDHQAMHRLRNEIWG